MELHDILWGIAGYIVFFIFQLTEPVRQRSGWDFFIQIAFFSLLSFVVARGLIAIFSSIVPDIHFFAAWWHIQFKYYFHSLTLIVGIVFAAPLIGIILVLPRIKNKIYRLFSWISKLSGGKRKNLEFTDLFFSYSHKLLKRLIMVTLKNGKVYIGMLIAATEDPNEIHRYIQISPITSGYRAKETHSLILNTNYIEDIKQPTSFPNRDILIPLAEILTLTEFDPDLHERFIKLGLTKVCGNQDLTETSLV